MTFIRAEAAIGFSLSLSSPGLTGNPVIPAGETNEAWWLLDARFRGHDK
jgi:hypothetical protein